MEGSRAGEGAVGDAHKDGNSPTHFRISCQGLDSHCCVILPIGHCFAKPHRLNSPPKPSHCSHGRSPLLPVITEASGSPQTPPCSCRTPTLPLRQPFPRHLGQDAQPIAIHLHHPFLILATIVRRSLDATAVSADKTGQEEQPYLGPAEKFRNATTDDWPIWAGIREKEPSPYPSLHCLLALLHSAKQMSRFCTTIPCEPDCVISPTLQQLLLGMRATTKGKDTHIFESARCTPAAFLLLPCGGGGGGGGGGGN